ncbi:two-component regulator propeller domain-containing protein [Reichenbachiella ulvae]|uniref:Two component regulator three Y domain-containing protein n=1 Tax=Reichenbachiella ulvae TaxID=2980104 RepID=A0ABT3CQU2_9BACT|nr:two-component regulator propeller domain-containing protein [Reichenbachiella ulvae]MCV9386009.1 hypothetical protein [Reichenbachiella ulvae]
MRERIRIGVLIAFGLIYGFAAHSQHPLRLQFQHIQKPLVKNLVETVCQDSYGYMWIGTDGGLHKSDGTNFELFTDAEGLPANYILSIYEDQNEQLWVGTNEGVARFDRKLNRFEHLPNVGTKKDDMLNDNWIRGILEDNTGRLWITSESRGLFYWEEDHFVHFPTGSAPGQINSRRTGGMTLDKDGRLWVATFDDGLYIIDTETLHATNHKKLYTREGQEEWVYFCWTLEADRDGTVWMGTKGTGLYHLELRQDSVMTRRFVNDPDDPNTLSNNEVYTLHIDQKGRLWVGNENGGLHLFDRSKEQFTRYEHRENDPRSLAQNSVRCVYTDSQDRLWVGTAFRGLDVFDPYYTKFTHYEHMEGGKKGLNNNLVRDFYEEENGNIWIATDGGGLNYWDRSENTFDYYMHDPDDKTTLNSDAILGLAEDPSGKLWVTGWSAGINVLTNRDQMTFAHYRDKGFRNSFPMNHFFDIIRDQKGNLWAANFGTGLMQYNWEEKTFRMLYGEPGPDSFFPFNRFTTLIEDSQGDLWIGTENAGVVRLMNKENEKPEFTILSEKKKIIYQILEGHQGYIWVGTDQGLDRIERQTGEIKTYGENDEWPSKTIVSIAEDDNHKLWLGTTSGLICFDPDNEEIETYDISDGLQGNEFSRYAATRLSTGELIFGGMNGFNIFHPDSVFKNPNLPPVYFTSFKIFNQEVKIGGEESPLNAHISTLDEITLTHEQSVFSLEFAAVNFTRSENNQYAFMLEGLEDQWNYVGTDHKATYSNLNPGEYTLRVKATNNDGIWNEKGATLRIIILPPWWKSWWAYSIMIIAGALIILMIVRLRTSYINDQKKRLQLLVDERTSQLEHQNNKVKEQADELKMYNESLNALNETLEETVKARTKELRHKNEKLAEYAFINAHNLRVPVANIKGIIQLFSQNKSREEIEELIELLRGQSEKLDKVLLDIQQMLDKDESLNKNKGRFKPIDKSEYGL